MLTSYGDACRKERLASRALDVLTSRPAQVQYCHHRREFSMSDSPEPSTPHAPPPGLELRDPRAGGLQPPRLRLNLQPHQRHNVARFLQCVRFGDGGILVADDLGLGKTCTAIACVETLRQVVTHDCKDFRTLVVVPKSVQDQWRDEILKFTYMEKATINYEHSPESMYHIITYETLRSVFERSYVKRDKEWIISSQGLHRFFLPDAFRVIIFDEVHRLRNKTAKVHHAARFLGATQRADWITPRIGLSGTPVINGFADISNIATVLRFPKRFTETKFFDTLNISTGSDFVTTCFIKHFKSETIELPELVTTFHSLDMSDEERRIHNEYVSKLNLEVVSFNEHRCTTFTDVIVALVRLRQVAIHPDLPAATPGSGAAATDTEDDSEDDSEDVEDDYGDDIEEDDATGNEKEVAARLREKRAAQKQQANKEAARKRRKKQAQDEAARERNAAAREAMHRAKNTWMRSTKLKWLVDRVDTYKQEDRKFLVFTSFSTSAHLVHEVLSERGLNTRLFVGSTTDAARRDAVLDFRAGRLDGLILTFGAGGTGLHLAPTGSAVIHLDATWTPAAHEQAECRLHRYGTTRDVVNDYALLEGSVDAYIIQNVHVKKQAFANALDRMVQHLQAKPVKYNSSSVNMAQVLSLLRWFATMKRQKMYEKQLQELEEEPPFGTSEQNALTAA